MSISFSKEPISGTVKDVEPIEIRMVRKTPLEPLWNELVRQYHYLGHCKMPGANLKYLVFAGGSPIAAFGFRAASFKLKPRDYFIGWSNEQKSKHLLQLANNNRFLILPWVKVKNLGSHLLARVTHHLLKDWHLFYNRELITSGNICGPPVVSRNRLQGSRMDPYRQHTGFYQKRPFIYISRSSQGGVSLPAKSGLSQHYRMYTASFQ